MENVGLVKIEQEAASVDINTRHDQNSVGCDNNSAISPFSNPNGISSFSGETTPTVIYCDVSPLSSFMQDTQWNSDSELLKNYEVRWLRLFQLVEKQCQEQIVAQQKVFYHQIHNIQNEIKHLMKLQSQNVCSCKKQISQVKSVNSFSSFESQMGLQSETFEENELLASHLKTSDPENNLEALAMPSECLTNSVSVSSGYGTCSAAELSPSKYKGIQKSMEAPEVDTKGKEGASPVPEDLVTASVQTTRKIPQTTVEPCPSLKKDNKGFSDEFEHKVSEGHCGKTNCKPLTSWAQKLKQNQLKKTNAEEGDVPVKEHSPPLTLENTKPTAAVPSSSYTFYLNEQNGSQNSFSSCTSGLTYWKLDEKETYHTLPENFRNEFCAFATKMSSEQGKREAGMIEQHVLECCLFMLSSGDEMKPSSLKEIYHKKQRECKQPVDWNVSPSQSTHPPEILTLDPTLHMKPGQQNPGPPPHSFYRVLFSPDSMADPPFFMHSDSDSLSHMSTVTSPLPPESPKYTSSATALHSDPWNKCMFQNETNASSSCHPSNEFLSTEEDDNLTLTPSSAAHSQLPSASNILLEYNPSVTCMEDPVVFSKIRQNLREKHARHIADLRAYYDSEIQSLKQQLEASHKPHTEDFEKINQNLADRCDRLQAALDKANNRTRALEDKNSTLETEVTDWKERFCAVSSTTKALQECIEEMRASGKEKDNTISRLKRRLKDLEEAFEKAYKLSDNKDAKLKEENKMFQDLLGEYESLGKEHERVKDTLNITENKLLDAHTQISDLKRTVSKLEAQIKQLEHENLLKFRHFADSHFRPSYAKSKLAGSDVSRRKWLIPGSEYSIFTGQLLEAQESAKDNRLEDTNPSCRYHTPPEKDSSPDLSVTSEISKKEAQVPETPIIKAFKELEGKKTLKNWATQTEKEEAAAPTKATTRRPTVGFDETALSASRSPEKGKDQLKHKRYSSPNGHRSSSLPPSNRKSNTPTRREIMLTPVAVTYSPKRSPKENLSPGFSHLLSKTENMVTRFDVLLDDLETAPTPASQYNNPRKKLQFHSAGDTEELKPVGPGKGSPTKPSSSTDSLPAGAKIGMIGQTWEDESSVLTTLSSAAPAPYEMEFKYMSRIKTLAETERLFDELTHEKQQIEAQLSRIPCAGGRMTLQARLNQEALEDRLERINRELGSIRMVLKRFHVLRTSANI